MPSSHHRVGLVADEAIQDALEVVRQANETSWPEARAAREAVFDGAFFESLRAAALVSRADADQAARVLRALQDLLPNLDLPAEIRITVAGRIDATVSQIDAEERRRRQLALLAGPDPYGELALDLSEEIDELDHFAG